MKLLIFGATGGTGRELVRQGLERGHTVTAFAREPSKVKLKNENLRIAKGNVLDYASVEDAVKDQDAVLSALGHKKFLIKTTILSKGTKNIITAMKNQGVRRFVCETSLGVGETRGKLGLYYTLFTIPFIVYFYFKDKGLQERYIKESGLDWVIVRPGQLTNGRKRGVYRHGPDVGNYIITLRISRADVADFMLNQLTEDMYIHMAPGVAY
ncbi:MAG TPA: SDR family oxidoreductase [Bacteroidota bacterium]